MIRQAIIWVKGADADLVRDYSPPETKAHWIASIAMHRLFEVPGDVHLELDLDDKVASIHAVTRADGSICSTEQNPVRDAAFLCQVLRRHLGWGEYPVLFAGWALRGDLFQGRVSRGRLRKVGTALQERLHKPLHGCLGGCGMRVWGDPCCGLERCTSRYLDRRGDLLEYYGRDDSELLV